jgi:hypothetical protein
MKVETTRGHLWSLGQREARCGWCSHGTGVASASRTVPVAEAEADSNLWLFLAADNLVAYTPHIS